MTAESSFCPSCYAEPGEPCAWDCIGLASQIDALEARLTPDAVPVDAHCLVCHAAALQDGRHAEGLIGRWMTVQASKDYARIYFRHELDASR